MLGQPMSMLIPQVVGFELRGELAEGATATDLVLTVTERLRRHGVVGKFVEFHGAGLPHLPIADRATIGNMSPEFGCTCAIFPVDAETLRYLELSGRPPEAIELVEAYAREQGLWHDTSSETPTFSERLELDLGDVVPSLAGPKRPQDRVSLTDARDSFRQALRDHVPDDGSHRGRDNGVSGTFPASDPPADTSPGHEADEHDAMDGAELDEAVEKGVATVASDLADRTEGAAAVAPDLADRGAAVRERERAGVKVELDGQRFELDHGDVVIAAITSCTNTSNPSVMVGAGILARNAVQRGLRSKPWVKTSLAPGSKVVTEYLDRAGLTAPLERLGFHLVGYGCTTCIGNSGPLPEPISEAVNEHDLAVVSVLSGNRNFEGRINADVKMNYLASPPLCVAYALAGTMDIDIVNDPLGEDRDGEPVHLRDVWPSEQEIAATVQEAVRSDMFRKSYGEVYAGDERWHSLRVPTGEGFAWPESTYVRRPPYFDGMPTEPEPIEDIRGARVLAVLGDSVTTDHISPAGSIKRDSPAGEYLLEQGVQVRDFNSYGSRRGNHEVMVRGTFANIRLRNQLAPGTEGGVTRHLRASPTSQDGESVVGEQMTIYEAAMRYASDGVPLVVLGGKEYGSGSSRDWAAKGTRLLGVRAVIAESFERIHRSNLVGMGVLPLQFPAGESAESLGLTGEEEFEVVGLAEPLNAGDGAPAEVTVRAGEHEFQARVRIDTPREAEYFRHGGILPFVLRQLRG
jgi:aconitate hydratase